MCDQSNTTNCGLLFRRRIKEISYELCQIWLSCSNYYLQQVFFLRFLFAQLCCRIVEKTTLDDGSLTFSHRRVIEFFSSFIQTCRRVRYLIRFWRHFKSFEIYLNRMFVYELALRSYRLKISFVFVVIFSRSALCCVVVNNGLRYVFFFVIVVAVFQFLWCSLPKAFFLRFLRRCCCCCFKLKFFFSFMYHIGMMLIIFLLLFSSFYCKHFSFQHCWHVT